MTNKMLEKFPDSWPDKSFNRYHYLISFEEIKAFVVVMILCGAFRAFREPLSDIYSSDLDFGRPIFRAVMPRERFKFIPRFLRFDDFSTMFERAKSDTVAPIRHLFDSLNNSFSSAYAPGKYITIDEHLCRYRGRCKFLQYLPNKPDKYGIKCWVIADSRTFYPLKKEVYTGKNLSVSNKPEDITLRLVSFLKPGHVIVGDNLFTSLFINTSLERI